MGSAPRGHRFAGRGRGSRGGPLVAPGRYRVVLECDVDGTKLQKITWLDVRPDPRLAESGITIEDLRALERAELRVRDGLRRTGKLASSLRKRIAKAPKDQEKRLRERLAEIVTRRDIEYAKPMLLDQWIYLAGVLAGGDRHPGQDALDRIEELESELRELSRDD